MPSSHRPTRKQQHKAGGGGLAYTLGALWNRTQKRKVLDEALYAVEAALGLIKEIGVQEHLPAAELARETILNALSQGGGCNRGLIRLRRV